MTHLFFQISKHLGKEKARETDLLGMTHATPPSLFSFLPLPDIWFQSLIPNGNPKAPHVRPVTFLPSPLLLSWSLHLRLQRNFSIYLHIPGLPRTSLKGGFGHPKWKCTQNLNLSCIWGERWHSTPTSSVSPNRGHLDPGIYMPSLNNFKRKYGLNSFPEDICLSHMLGSCTSLRISCWSYHSNE